MACPHTRPRQTGMLATSDVINTVVTALKRHGPLCAIVVDPVMVAANGDPLIQPEAVETMKSELLPMATVITPNM